MAPARNRPENVRPKPTAEPHLYAPYPTAAWSTMDQDLPQSPDSRSSVDSDHMPLDSVPPGQEIQVANPHTRTYQACDECRRRKIKCDMGPVDNPQYATPNLTLRRICC